MQIDHASVATWFYPSLRDTAGVSFGARWDEAQTAILGGARLYGRDDLAWLRQFLDEILQDREAGREIPDVGLSAVLYAAHENVVIDETEGIVERIMREISHVESVDFVFGPGAEGRLRDVLYLFNRFSVIGGINMDENTQVGTAIATPGVASAPLPPAIAAPNPLATVPSADLQAVLARVDALQGSVDRLNVLLAREEDANVVEGMGHASRNGTRISGMETGLDRFTPAVDWLFGVADAPLPDPQYRRADNIYQAFTGDWEWQGRFVSERVALASATTGTLPGLAINAMNKVVFTQWASLRQYRWYELVTTVVPNDGSTNPMQWIGVGGLPVLPIVAEGGAYTELTPADTKEADDFNKYGAYVGITLEMFRRSEIAKIQAITKGLARSSVMTRSAKVASIFTQASGVGPTLDQDGIALFHASHGNVATTAFGTDSTAWNAVDLEIWNQAEIGSAKPIAVSPKYMLCRRNLYRAALVVFGYGDGQPTTYVPEAVDRGPDDPRPFPISVPDFTDTNDWAALADPQVYPVIGMSYAQAMQGNVHPMPELFSVLDPTAGLVFSNDTFPVKARDWFSFGVNGFRGIAKRNVA